MIAGVVNDRHEAIIRLRVRGPGGVERELDTIVDSGFSASLTLSKNDIAALALERETSSKAVLADGSFREFDIYNAEVFWNGAWRPIFVSAVGNESL